MSSYTCSKCGFEGCPLPLCSDCCDYVEEYIKVKAENDRLKFEIEEWKRLLKVESEDRMAELRRKVEAREANEILTETLRDCVSSKPGWMIRAAELFASTPEQIIQKIQERHRVVEVYKNGVNRLIKQRNELQADYNELLEVLETVGSNIPIGPNMREWEALVFSTFKKHITGNYKRKEEEERDQA